MKRKTVHQQFYSTVFSPPFCWFMFLVLSSGDQGAPCSCRWKGEEEGRCWLTPGCKPRHTGCWAERGRHKPGKRRADTLRAGYHWKGSPPLSPVGSMFAWVRKFWRFYTFDQKPTGDRAVQYPVPPPFHSSSSLLCPFLSFPGYISPSWSHVIHRPAPIQGQKEPNHR